eukprot:gene30952-biopygen16783
MEGFNQSKMIDPKTKHWYLSIKADAGIDSVKVAKIEESLGACYRALVEFPGVGSFPHDSLPIDVFQTFAALSVRKGEQSKTFMVLMDGYYPAVFGNELTISTNGYAKCNVGHIHTMIYDAGVTVDHINRIPLDNRRKNLRVATTMSVQNGNRVSSVEIAPPEELKPYFDEMPTFLRWDRNYLRFVSDKYSINGTRSKKVSIVNKFRDAAVKLKNAIIEDIEYSRHLATLNQLRDDYIQINKLVHSLYPEHFDMYNDSTDKVYWGTPEFIDQCLAKLQAAKEGNVLYSTRALSATYRPDESFRTFFGTGELSDVPSVVRDRVPWEFMPFGLKYCFNKAQSMEGFNQSKIIDPRTKHWYLSKKSDASVDSRQCREGRGEPCATTNVASAPEEGSPSPEHAASAPEEGSSREEEAGANEEKASAPEEDPSSPDESDVVELVEDLVIVIEYVFAVHENSKRVAHVHQEVLKAVPQKIEDELQRTPSVELAEYVCHRDYPVDRVRIERDLDVLQDSHEQTSYDYPDCFADTHVKKTKSRRAWILYVLKMNNNGMTRVKLTTAVEKEQFCSNVLNTKVSDKFVCKDLNSATAFNEEIRTAELLFRNVSASGLAKSTTFSSITFKRFNVISIDLGGKAILSRDSGFYVFSLRCSMSAASKVISSDADMDKFVRETLENFDVIHRAGIIHGDVKLDNMIYCAKDDRYRLIDWGKTADHADMLARYVDNTRFRFVNNTSSRMAWFCSGLNYAASLLSAWWTTATHRRTCQPRVMRCDGGCRKASVVPILNRGVAAANVDS